MSLSLTPHILGRLQLGSVGLMVGLLDKVVHVGDAQATKPLLGPAVLSLEVLPLVQGSEKEGTMEARETLARAPLFSNLKRDILDTLARSARVRRFAPGELLVEEGQDATAFYVLCEGEAEVVKRLGEEGEQVVGHLSEGDFFGEMTLLDGFPRSASVRAVRDCECLLLVRWDFLALARTSPEVPLAILPVLSRRLRECEEQLLP